MSPTRTLAPVWTFTVFGLAIALSGCDAPGEGPKADLGYKRSAPIIAALAQYHQAHGTYPDALSDLGPSFSEYASFQQPSFDYHKLKDTYELSFSYTGPGTNSCDFSPGKKWKCYGAY